MLPVNRPPARVAFALVSAWAALAGCAREEPRGFERPPPGVKLGQLPPASLAWQADFSELTPGAAADPAGVTYTRASAATTIHPLLEAPAEGGFGPDQARIVATKGGRVGLFLEGAATNLHASDAPWDGATWILAPTPGSSTTLDISEPDPTGTLVTAKHAVLPGGVSRSDGTDKVFHEDALGELVTSHMWAKGTGTFQTSAFDGILPHGAARALQGGWEHIPHTFIASALSRSITPADGRDTTEAGGTSAGPRSYRTARHMVEVGPRASSWVAPGATRAGARASIDDLATLAPDGRLRFEWTWIAPYPSSALPWSPRLFTIDAANYAEIDRDARSIRVVVGGRGAWVSAPITWGGGEIVTLRLDVGAGPTTGTVHVGEGRVAGILDGRELPPLPSAGRVDIACDGPRAELEGVHLRWRAYARSPRHGSVVVSDTASLVSALAALDPARGPTRILLRGGVYPIRSPIVLTAKHSGVAIAAYPGETPILDGGEVLAGAWKGPDAQGVYVLPLGGSTRQMWVNGARAIRARSALDPAGWAETPTGFMAPSAGEAAKVGPGGELVGRNLWRMFRVGVAGVSGAEITARSADWANAQSMGPQFDMQALWWAEGRGYVGEGEGFFWHDRDAELLFYHPRPGEEMATAEVVRGAVERVIVVSGTLDEPAQDITISGLTVRHTAWSAPDEGGATNVQSSIFWTGGAKGDSYLKPPSAITAASAVRLTITGSTVERTGGDAVSFEVGTTDSAVLDGVIRDTAAGGVSIGDVTHFEEDPWPADARAVLARDVIANNLFRDIAQDYRGSNAVFGAYTSGLVVARNDIDATPYTAIAIGWGWGYNDPPGFQGSGWPAGLLAPPVRDTPLGDNRVARNRITSFLLSLDDGGAVYMLAKQSNGGRSSVIGNYIRSRAGSGVNQAGVYLDNGCQGVDVRANVLEETQDVFARAASSTSLPNATGSSVIGNYTDAGAYSGPPGNTIAGNLIGPLGGVAAAIRAAAGRLGP